MVRIFPYKRGGWEVDIRLTMPDNSRIRERKIAPVSSRSSALRWGQERERLLLLGSLAQPQKKEKEVPTLEEFAPRFVNGYLKAERRKASVIHTNESLLRVHLLPFLGKRKLDSITSQDVAQIKGRLATAELSKKSVNNILSVLRCLLHVAKSWGDIPTVACEIKFLRVPPPEMAFLDFDEFQRLLAAAKAVDSQASLVALLGGHAGLRCGEMLPLAWTDIDLKKGELHVRRATWKGRVDLPKGGRSRTVPLTDELRLALRDARHLRGPLVLSHPDGRPLSDDFVRRIMEHSTRKAGLAKSGVHILRHTFCSHLAMRGASARAIQLLAGHADLATTMRYMHLSPEAKESAIRLLDEPIPVFSRGDVGETAFFEKAKLLKTNE